MKVLAISHACVRAPNREIYSVLRERGVDIELLIPTGIYKGRIWIEADPDGPCKLTVHRSPIHGKSNRYFRYEKLAETLRNVAPTVVILESDTASLLTLEVGRWCKSKGACLICLTHTNLSWRVGEAVQRGGLSEFVPSIIKVAVNSVTRQYVDHIFSTSHETTRLFEENGFPNATEVPIGTSCRLFKYRSKTRHAVRAELGVSDDERVVAFFGRFVPEKGIDTLIQALSRLTDLKWRLMLNSFESNSVYERQTAKLIRSRGLAERVIWFTSRHGEIARLMTAADATVVPSRTTPRWVEQFGRVVTEAMACGNLVFVSDSGTPKCLVGAAGFVFPEGDDQALAAVLRTAASDRKRCMKMRRDAIRRVRSHLSVDVQAEIYLKVLNGLSKN